MTEEEQQRLIQETNAKIDAALEILLLALHVAGAEVKDIKRLKGEHPKIVEVTFPSGGKREANITADSAPAAIYDVLKQVPELRS